MPRHPRLRHQHRPSSAARRPRPASYVDPAASLRSLIHEGIMTAAALDARDDLGAAAISMQRLGELEGRAHALGVAPDAVLAAAAAAGHLDEHRQTLERLELGGWVLPIDL